LNLPILLHGNNTPRCFTTYFQEDKFRNTVNIIKSEHRYHGKQPIRHKMLGKALKNISLFLYVLCCFYGDMIIIIDKKKNIAKYRLFICPEHT